MLATNLLLLSSRIRMILIPLAAERFRSVLITTEEESIFRLPRFYY